MNALQSIVTVLSIHHNHLFAQTFRFSNQDFPKFIVSDSHSDSPSGNMCSVNITVQLIIYIIT